MSVRDNL